MDEAALARYPLIGRPGSTPMAIARAEGAYLYTPDGREILDAAGGAIVANIGHGRAEVAEAMARTTALEGYVVPTFATPSRLELYERLRSAWLPRGLDRILLTSGGSEAVDAAIRLARQHFVARREPGRWKIVGRDLAYHGANLSGLSAGGHLKRRKPFGPLLEAWPKAPACYCLRCPLDRSYPGCGVACVDAVAELIEREGANTIAAVIAEPIVGSTAGALTPPDEYWPRLSEICRHYGVLLIADEVMTGFGRTGRRFAVDHWGVVPDILVSGKGLAGGYAPLVGLFAREEVTAALAEGGQDLMFTTFGGLPGAAAAANAVLEILDREDLVRRAAEQGEALRKRLASLEAHPNVAEVRGKGLLLGIELVEDRETLTPFPKTARLTERVVAAGLRDGVFFYPGGCPPAQDAIVLGPPFIIGAAEVERIAAVLESALDATVARIRSERSSR